MEVKNYCGFIAIIGRPNVGKSTLMNHLIGQKVSITSRKPQTTRHKVSGVYTKDNYQYIFVDTPGFQKRYLTKLNQALNQSVINSLSQVDAVIFVVEAGIFNLADEEVLKLIPDHTNAILAVNKADKLKDKNELARFTKSIKSKYPFKATLKVAAKHSTGIEELVTETAKFLPGGVFLYPLEQLTDKSSRFLASEMIREKLFRYLGEELPYSTMVEIEQFEENPQLIKIQASIIVDKENQKGIVIGKGGEKLKKISTDAREDMEILLGIKVFLQIWVKVRSGFADDIKFLKQFQ